MNENIKNLGWRVTFAGLSINLALGILYTWSVISNGIPVEWGWTEVQKSLPYSIACIVFAVMMVPAGRMQDRIGPRWIALAGGIAVGVGMIMASFASSVSGFVIGFGVLAGAGIGMAYASATPPAVKWFPPKRTGLIAGLVVSGFGLASVYISPLAKYLIGTYGLQTSLLIFGSAFLLVVCALSQFLVNPPAGYRPEASDTDSSERKSSPAPAAEDHSWQEMLKTPQFYSLWMMYAFGAGAGLMIIGKLAKIVNIQAGMSKGFWMVAILAVGNAAGRVIAGVLSDRIGRTMTMFIVFLFQAVMMFALPFVSTPAIFVIISMILGFNYGANLSLFPSATKDFFGMKNFGVNYGLVFTAWGFGGLVLPIISGKVFDAYGSFDLAYKIAGVCLLIAAGLSFTVKAPSKNVQIVHTFNKTGKLEVGGPITEKVIR
ncbi:OFA family MFS transporter [Thermodesulfobacteriota bacterium]